MQYFEAKELIDEQGIYASADFYRVKLSPAIALAVRDSASLILTDVINHGSPEAHNALEHALACGYIEPIVQDEVTVSYKVLLGGESASVEHLQKHIAMQIAYPELYSEFFDGSNIWDLDHPKMKELLELTISCLTNKNHPSDIYGQHHIKTDADKGRPKAKKQPKQASGSFANWVEACKAYKEELRLAWEGYLQACRNKKEQEVRAKQWRDGELDKLRAQMSEVSRQYEAGLRHYESAILEAKEKHSLLKAKGAPQRCDFE